MVPRIWGFAPQKWSPEMVPRNGPQNSEELLLELLLLLLLLLLYAFYHVLQYLYGGAKRPLIIT